MKNGRGLNIIGVLILATFMVAWLNPAGLTVGSDQAWKTDGSTPAWPPVFPTAQASRSKEPTAAPTKKATAAPTTDSSGYSRAQFGQAWSDDVTVAGGHNGCDTRNDILAVQLAKPTFKAGTHNCVVMSGILTDPYSGRTVNFVKADAGKVQIDHVIALKLVWTLGADRWSADQRRNFANDPINLMAIDGQENGSKSSKSPAEWSPTTKSGRCLYATHFTQVATAYSVDIPNADRAALAGMLQDC